MSSARSPYGSNLLLARLPAEDLQALLPSLVAEDLAVKRVLYREGEAIDRVYFLSSGMVSFTSTLSDGSGVEIQTMGREGLAGTQAILGVDHSSHEAFMQIAGTGFSILCTDLRRQMQEREALRNLLLRYVQSLFVRIARTTVCNVRHTINERLARWLLIAHDRVDGDELPLTQEFLSLMLGVRRPGVTLAAGTLQQAGLISYAHGLIRILDRPLLEAAACECYAREKEQMREIMGPDATA